MAGCCSAHRLWAPVFPVHPGGCWKELGFRRLGNSITQQLTEEDAGSGEFGVGNSSFPGLAGAQLCQLFYGVGAGGCQSQHVAECTGHPRGERFSLHQGCCQSALHNSQTLGWKPAAEHALLQPQQCLRPETHHWRHQVLYVTMLTWLYRHSSVAVFKPLKMYSYYVTW